MKCMKMIGNCFSVFLAMTAFVNVDAFLQPSVLPYSIRLYNTAGNAAVPEDNEKQKHEDNPNRFSEMFQGTLAEAVVQSQQPQEESRDSMKNIGETVYYIVAFYEDDSKTPPQAIHSIEYPPMSGSNVVLAFESKEGCEGFAQRLRAQNFVNPQPQEMEMDALFEFARKLGVYVQAIPRGFDVIPPSQNVQHVGQHNRRLRAQQDRLEAIFAGGDGHDGPSVAAMGGEGGRVFE